MRLAGEKLEDGSLSSGLAMEAIQRQNMARTPIMDAKGLPSFSRVGFEPEVASHHVDLDSGREGFINDGIDKSILYKGGKQVEGRGEEFRNPLQGQPSGAKELRQLDRRDYENYDDIFEQQMIQRQGTGNYASTGVGLPFAV